MTDPAGAEAVRQKAKALSRWEGEGGALGPAPMTLDEADMRILARLGAGLLIEWNTVSNASRNAIFTRAAALHAERDALQIKNEITRFLETHKDR